jgi:hypothetical protein
MAIHNDIPNSVIEEALSSFERDAFTTLTVVDYLEKNHNSLVEDLKGWSPRNWRSVVGKKLKVYSLETNKIKQVSPSSESPARWKKFSI